MEILLTIFIRSVVAIVLMLLFTHFLGKHIISQMTNYHFIAAITMGSIIGNMVFNTNINFFTFIFSFIIFSGIISLLTFFSIKNQKLNRFISGKPVTVIEEGKILENNMKKIKYTFDMLKQGLRQQGIFNIDEVSYAVLEPNGKLSIFKKAEPQTISIPIEVIFEGKILYDNLLKHRLSTDWLELEITKRGSSLSEISYGVLGTNGSLYFDFYHDHIK